MRAPRPRIDGLDGLRAFAVVWVLLYHADVSWARGGFIGVDLFFVLSGYLVTSIVTDAVARKGHLGFRSFWASRLRRLAPAQVALLVVTTVAVALFASGDLASMRGQVIAALTGTTNWYLIATEGSYFEQQGRPPVLRHLWSLAVELQFYLLFPPVLAMALRRWRGRPELLLRAVLVAILASTIYLAVLFSPDSDPTRAYFDTFARLGAPLVGAALALVWRPTALRRGPVSRAGAPVSLAGFVALVALLWAVDIADDRSAAMYRGGFLVVALLSAVTVAAAVHPGSAFGSRRLLGHPVLVAIGVRSYGLYLWHWPVFTLLRPGIDVDWSWRTTFVVRMVLTIVLTELCYRLVERPWHLRARDASLAGIRRRLLQPAGIPTRTRLLALGSTFMAMAALVILIVPHEADTTIEDSIAAGEAALAEASGTTLAPGAPTTTTTTAVDPATLLPDDGRVTMVGDSVMVGAAPNLLARFGEDGIVDAAVARQAADIPPVLSQLAMEGRLGSTVVVQVGINGTVTEDDLRAISDAVPGRRLIIINARVPRTWEAGNLATIARVVPRLPNATVLDWYEASAMNGDWYLDDRIHLTEAGRAAYTDAIAEAVEEARSG